jgi:ethanolamine ammonia-lyase large subunit
MDPLIADNDAVQPMARPSKPELPAESRTRTIADEVAMAKYDKLKMYYSQDLREFTLENDKLVAFKDKVYSTVSQALRELLLPE